MRKFGAARPHERQPVQRHLTLATVWRLGIGGDPADRPRPRLAVVRQATVPRFETGSARPALSVSPSWETKHASTRIFVSRNILVKEWKLHKLPRARTVRLLSRAVVPRRSSQETERRHSCGWLTKSENNWNG